MAVCVALFLWNEAQYSTMRYRANHNGADMYKHNTSKSLCSNIIIMICQSITHRTSDKIAQQTLKPKQHERKSELGTLQMTNHLQIWIQNIFLNKNISAKWGFSTIRCCLLKIWLTVAKPLQWMLNQHPANVWKCYSQMTNNWPWLDEKLIIKW